MNSYSTSIDNISVELFPFSSIDSKYTEPTKMFTHETFMTKCDPDLDASKPETALCISSEMMNIFL